MVLTSVLIDFSDRIARALAFAALKFVITGMLLATARLRIFTSSALGLLSVLGVLITKLSSPFLIISRTLGRRFSASLNNLVTGIPASSITLAVPSVEKD